MLESEQTRKNEFLQLPSLLLNVKVFLLEQNPTTYTFTGAFADIEYVCYAMKKPAKHKQNASVLRL